jgi:steroid 5-alpha reductase family enzyme
MRVIFMKKQINHKHIKTCLIISASVIAISLILPEIAIAAKFDIDAGVKAATDPIIKGINDHWGKAVVITGTAGAVVGEGDARQRATRAAFAACAAGGVVLALIAMLT